MKNSHLVCPGFRAAGIACGIKDQQSLDLGLILAERPCRAAGIFTRNRVQAAPVVISRLHLAAGDCRAIVANSGNANCCTGDQGQKDALDMCQAVGRAAGIDTRQVLVASTGVIGQRLPVEKITTATPSLVDDLAPDGFGRLAQAIMTTDTRPKMAGRRGSIGGRDFTLVAVAKGAGMIRPDMATMLCFVCTDVEIENGLLQQILTQAGDQTFNRITIDGDTSTNDTVFVMASGLCGVKIDTGSRAVFQQLLTDLMAELALELVRDGEGVTKVVWLEVQGAPDNDHACRIAEAVAHSPLVKTAFYGQDANWGRIIAAAGRAGVPFDPDMVDIYFDDVLMVRRGLGCGPQAEEKATAVLHRPEFRVTVDLNQGRGSWSLITSDLSLDYVRINADYRS